MQHRTGLPTSNPVTALLLVQLFLIVGGHLLTRSFIHQWKLTSGGLTLQLLNAFSLAGVQAALLVWGW